MLYRFGALAFLGVLVFSVYVSVKNKNDFSLSRTAFFFTLVLFFLPMFASNNIDVAFFSYAIAHGVQYLAFMTVLTLDLGTREGRHGVTTLIDFLAGIGLGTTIAHFVIDAGAWRLSQPSARHYVTQRFGFLFERASGRSRGVGSQAFSR